MNPYQACDPHANGHQIVSGTAPAFPVAAGSSSMCRRFKRSWRELGFFERAAIIRDIKERRETPEDRAISAALIDARKTREAKEAKMAKLRAFLLAKRTKPSSPNAKTTDAEATP